MVKYWTAQEILSKIEECKRDDPGDIISLDCTGTPEDEFEALYRITTCKANKEYYDDVRIIRVGNLLILEHKELEHLSGVTVEIEALMYIASHLYSFVNNTSPMDLPYENPKDMENFIKRVKRKINKETYVGLISKCLTTVHIGRLMDIEDEKTFEQEVDIITTAIENVRYQLTGETQRDIMDYVYHKCKKLRNNTVVKYDDEFEGPLSELTMEEQNEKPSEG